MVSQASDVRHIEVFQLRFFDHVDVCKIRDSGWHEVRLSGLLSPLCCSCLLLTVLEPTEVELILFQESTRYD